MPRDTLLAIQGNYQRYDLIQNPLAWNSRLMLSRVKCQIEKDKAIRSGKQGDSFIHWLCRPPAASQPERPFSRIRRTCQFFCEGIPDEYLQQNSNSLEGAIDT